MRPGSILFTVWAWLAAAGSLAVLWLTLRFVPSGTASYGAVHRSCRRLFALCGCPLRVSGAEHLSGGQAAILVANHSSYLDSLVLHAALPGEHRFVVNHVAASRPVLGLVIRKLRSLVVDRRSRQSRTRCAREMLASLDADVPVIVFPEGTRSTGELMPFEDGPFRVAVAAGRPVVPVAIRGTRQVWRPGAWRVRRGPVDVRVLTPLVTGNGGDAARVRDAAHLAIAESLTAV